jgi:dinuclear metal center YbgI/SA1388 family protein
VPILSDVIAVLDELFDPRLAESWDAVGLVCGDPDQQVRRVLLAVDPVAAVVDEALDWGADLVLTHHPLYLRGTSSVAADDPKGNVVHRLLRAGAALHVAHTNADRADTGVSDALAHAIGLRDLAPLVPAPDGPLDKIVTFVPTADAERVLDALASAGAGRIGDYDRCAYTSEGTGTFRAGAGANPTIGTVGAVERVPEARLEMVAPRGRRGAVVRALLAAHPYEEPAYDVFALAERPSGRGLGRIGRLPKPEPFAAFADRVARGLPATPAGIRAAGDPERLISTVAVLGGAGDSELATVRRAGVDSYVTADLRHHPASEAMAARDAVALIDGGHWATEWPWLGQTARQLTDALSARGTTVETRVSTIVTDPWTLQLPTHR